MMVAQIELRPVGLLRQIERLLRTGRITCCETGPRDSDSARQLSDRIFRSSLEMVLCLREVARLEGGDAEQKLRHAMRLMRARKLLCERNGLRPVSRHGLHLEGLLKQYLVCRVALEGTAV